VKDFAVIHLAALAKSSPEGFLVPGTALEVSLVQAGSLTLRADLWLMVLGGELIIDLPHGDFRILKEGDCISLKKGLQLGFQPLEEVIILKQTAQFG
jgi:hypothetical protein